MLSYLAELFESVRLVYVGVDVDFYLLPYYGQGIAILIRLGDGVRILVLAESIR